MSSNALIDIYKDKGLATATLYVLFALFIFLPLYILYEGWAITVLWDWFAIPLGAPVVTLAHAAGLSALLNLMIMPALNSKTTAGVGTFLFKPIMAVAVGACVHHFM